MNLAVIICGFFVVLAVIFVLSLCILSSRLSRQEGFEEVYDEQPAAEPEQTTTAAQGR